MNWKNITLEPGFVKQELEINGTKAVNYIPLEQVDSFGVVSSENKLWLYAGAFMGLCTLAMLFGGSIQPSVIFGLISAGLFFVYFATRQTWFNITSSQTKFSVKVLTTKEELQAVNAFVMKIKESLHTTKVHQISEAA